jgi:hypothetical protein
MSQHHTAAKWASETKGHRARIRAAGRVQPCSELRHAAGCPGLLDLDIDSWDVGHLDGVARGGPVAPSWRTCNRANGGRQGAGIRHAVHREATRMRAW